MPMHKARGQASPCALCRHWQINHSWFWVSIAPSPQWSLHIDNSCLRSNLPRDYWLQTSFIFSCLHLRYTVLLKGRVGARGKPVCWPTVGHFGVDRGDGPGVRRMGAFRPDGTWVSFRARALCQGGLIQIWRNLKNTCMHSESWTES